jgi:hypothetical protein
VSSALANVELTLPTGDATGINVRTSIPAANTLRASVLVNGVERASCDVAAGATSCAVSVVPFPVNAGERIAVRFAYINGNGASGLRATFVVNFRIRATGN